MEPGQYYNIQAAIQNDIPDELYDLYLKEIYGRKKAFVYQPLMKWDLLQSFEMLKTGWDDILNIAPSNPDYEMLTKIGQNLSKFAAFKNYNDVKRLISLASGNDNFEKFKTEAKTVRSNYNRNWQNAEQYRIARGAENARQWQKYERNVHLYPNLRYVAVMDERTRKSHRELNGLVYPVNHPFWNTYAPQNDWGCRCRLEQTDSGTNMKRVTLEVPAGFDNNVGKTGEIFPKHPYLKSDNKDYINSQAAEVYDQILGND